MSQETRLQRLEQRAMQQWPWRHHTSIVRVPVGVDAADWLREPPCACGKTGCLARTVGLMLRESADAWDAMAVRQQAATLARLQEITP